MKIKIILMLIVSLSFISCETDITVDLPTPEEKLIVQGKIETGEHPFVFLSKNIGYFEPVNIPQLDENANFQDIITALENSIGLIFDSTVVMTMTTMDGNIDTLKPAFNLFDFPHFGYQANNIKGVENQTYRLDITYNEKNFWSETTIPQSVSIDSVWFNFNNENDTLGTLGFSILDPQAERNFYMVTAKVLEEQLAYNPPYFGNYIFDDDLLDGDTIKYTALLKPYDGNDFFQMTIEDQDQFDQTAFYELGSTVNIKLSTIDIATFVFWNSYMVHLGTAGNPFTNPSNLKSNINGDNCDGIWAGYGTHIKTVTIDSAIIRE